MEDALLDKSEFCEVYWFKLFGADAQTIKEFIAAHQASRFTIEYKEEFLDFTVKITYGKNAYKSVIDGVISDFKTQFSDYIYAEENQTLAQTLVTLLRQKGKVLSVAESFTGGGVARSIVSVSGASEVFYESIVAYHSNAKIQRLGVAAQTIKNYGAVSNETAYEMALSLLLGRKCDIAISTTGLAGPNTDESGLPVGLFFVAVGDCSGIHVYRYQVNGNREYVTNVGINASLYRAILKLKNI
ncbi:MAG: CinA family protein [Clostridia bacterium]|nr:CinA family protein [Clostridia bacterium]